MAVKNGAYSLEEKREAVAYFNKNEAPKEIEQLLNKMFKEKPSDIFGYMVRKWFVVLAIWNDLCAVKCTLRPLPVTSFKKAFRYVLRWRCVERLKAFLNIV